MKRNAGSKVQSVLMLILGLAALALRMGLYAVATDAKGLLVRNHPLALVLSVLTGLALALVAFFAWKQKETDCSETGFAENMLAALGTVALGAGILVTVLLEGPVLSSNLVKVWWILGMAAPACLMLNAMLRLLGKRPLFLPLVAVCLFFLVHIVTRYQLWSANPQMQDYFYALLGAMALMFFGFYEASQAADCGNPRLRLGMGLAAVYLCAAELARSACPALYLGGILWVLSQLCCAGKKEKQ